MAPLKTLEDTLFPLPDFAQPLSSAQMTTYLVHRFTTPSFQLLGYLTVQPIVRASDLFREIEIAFDQKRDFPWHGKLSPEHWNPSYFVERNLFRAMLHACVVTVCTTLARSS